MYFGLNVYNAKQGEYFISYRPALNISGYGKTRVESERFLEIELQIFGEGVIAMPVTKKTDHLQSLGFKKEPRRNKGFSRAYVDQDGLLQNFEEGSLKHKVLANV